MLQPAVTLQLVESAGPEPEDWEGAFGSFGLARISALAGSIEERVGEGRDVADLVDELKAAVEATRAATDQLPVDV